MSRLVVVLGREPVVNVGELVQRAWRERSELVVLNLGLPLSALQQDVIDGLLETAEAVEFEALICYDAAQVATSIQPEDRVIFASTPQEQHEIECAAVLPGEQGRPMSAR